MPISTNRSFTLIFALEVLALPMEYYARRLLGSIDFLLLVPDETITIKTQKQSSMFVLFVKPLNIEKVERFCSLFFSRVFVLSVLEPVHIAPWCKLPQKIISESYKYQYNSIGERIFSGYKL